MGKWGVRWSVCEGEGRGMYNYARLKWAACATAVTARRVSIINRPAHAVASLLL